MWYLNYHVPCLHFNCICTLPIKQEFDYVSIVVSSCDMKWCLAHLHGTSENCKQVRSLWTTLRMAKFIVA